MRTSEPRTDIFFVHHISRLSFLTLLDNFFRIFERSGAYCIVPLNYNNSYLKKLRDYNNYIYLKFQMKQNEGIILFFFMFIGRKLKLKILQITE